MSYSRLTLITVIAALLAAVATYSAATDVSPSENNEATPVAAEEEQGREAAAVQEQKRTDTQPESADCQEKNAVQLIEKFKAEAVGGLPPCPQVTPCVGGGFKCKGTNSCGATYSVVDTGVQSCDTLTCQFGETVHIETGVCERCPCCDEDPACACLSVPCGTAIAAVFCN